MTRIDMYITSAKITKDGTTVYIDNEENDLYQITNASGDTIYLSQEEVNTIYFGVNEIRKHNHFNQGA